MRIRRIVLAAGAVLAGALALRALSRALHPHSIAGEAVFITGGSRGLGFALAAEAARRGARIAICARDPEKLARAAERLRERGAEVVPLTCDVRDAGALDVAIRQAFAAFGRLDMLINNAGTIAVGPMDSLTRQDYEDAMNTHFWAMYSLVEASVRFLKRKATGVS